MTGKHLINKKVENLLVKHLKHFYAENVRQGNIAAICASSHTQPPREIMEGEGLAGVLENKEKQIQKVPRNLTLHRQNTKTMRTKTKTLR